MSVWKKYAPDVLKQKVFDALANNVNYEKEFVLGLPATYLDTKVFSQDASFLKDAPFMYSMTQNPNHIGCHTLGKSERFFAGTHQLEKELLDICAIDILKANPNEFDAYVASGGTEANIQAMWIYRNYFLQEHQAIHNEIAILCSEDSHYSVDKAANLLNININKFPVEDATRLATTEMIANTIQLAKENGIKYFMVQCNMMTTMFGSVDNIDDIVTALQNQECNFKIHIDGAFGGFYYPFSDKDSKLTFENPHISSFTLDAHKMGQAPYGTGIFICRKGLIQYANTQAAKYVEGEDYTLIGSRSGANAIAVWMILSTHGPYGWFEKIFVLQNRTDWMTKQLTNKGILFYSNPFSNIITIRANNIDKNIASKYGLVPDNHNAPNWYKIVVMEHVSIEKLAAFLEEI